MCVSEYNKQQMEALLMVRRYLKGLTDVGLNHLKGLVENYLLFREHVALFQKQHFSEICTQRCFTSRKSACCGREGIATFFADVVVNGLLCTDDDWDAIEETLRRDKGGFKCVYLTEMGCVWPLKPIVCEMFLCDRAKESVLGKDDALRIQWEALRKREKQYTWPDRPVLFDEIEGIFIETGLDSPLMYLHRSPGLLRVKAQSSGHGHGDDRK